MSMRFSLCALVLAVLVNLSCEHADPLTAGGPEPTLSRIQAEIFNQKCAFSGCHAGASAPQGLDLSQGVAFGNLVNTSSREVPSLSRVAPGNPNDSYLLMKLRGDPRIVGAQMPLTGDKLNQAQLDLISAWIQAGAPNN
jgi:hypothetical protein